MSIAASLLTFAFIVLVWLTAMSYTLRMQVMFGVMSLAAGIALWLAY